VAATDLEKLSASALARLIARGEMSSEALVRACLDRIAARDKLVKAWSFIDPELALRQARERDRAPARAKLHGVPLAVKDIIDAAEMPTGCNSPIYRDHRPARDAVCVERARQAGAVILGKTATAEFAYVHPAKTRNPHDLDRTPGGSSSGSVAAVADCMVPLALGTQTGGSTIRPASYCGVYGMKPTYARISMDGVKALSATFDTVGLIARSLEDVDLLFSCLVDPSAGPLVPPRRRPRIGYCETPFWEEARDEMREAMRRARATLEEADLAVEDVALPDEIRIVSDGHRTLMAVEATFNLRHEYSEHSQRLSRVLRELIADGFATAAETEQRFRAAQAGAMIAVDRLFDRYDLLLTPSAPGEADPGNAVGDSIFNRLWTAMHTPCLTLPYAIGPNGLPVGIQLIARRGHDEAMLRHAVIVDRLLNPRGH
jgi:Asp-tRNA(Asn)/Glu-tRNA(Gln) amidotransferase A subunit family amidase